MAKHTINEIEEVVGILDSSDSGELTIYVERKDKPTEEILVSELMNKRLGTEVSFKFTHEKEV